MSTPADLSRPVLLLGGYGSLGSRTARMLRQLYPDLPLTIGGRDLAKADALAAQLGAADGVQVDLSRPDLGLPGGAGYSLVVTAARDHALTTLTYAQDRGIGYLALSDTAFEIGPLVAWHAHRPAACPVLILGHSIGSVPTLSALHFAAAFERVDAIEIGLVFDPDDPLGSMSAADMAHLAQVGPPPLLLHDGRWRWATADLATRPITGVGGTQHQAQAAGLVDVLSLWPSTWARSLRVDIAVAQTASRRRGEPPSHEVVIEITGLIDGGRQRRRHELVDPQGYATLSARGVAVAVETMLGLTPTPAPAPGLYLPELLVEPAHLVRRLGEFGVQVAAAAPPPP